VDAPENSTPEPQESAPSGVDFSPVLDRVGQLADQVGSLSERFESFGQPQQPEQQEEDPWASVWGDDPEPEPQQPAFDPAAVQAAIQAEIQRSVSPYAEQVQQLRTQQDLKQLYEDHPQLNDQAYRQDVSNEVTARAQEIGVDPSMLLNNRAFVDLTIKAMEGAKLAAQQQPPGAVAELEAGGGANPGGANPDTNIAQEIVSARTTLPSAFL
jgi:hypothetical protein